MILTWSVLRLVGLVTLAVLTGLAAVKAHGTKETLVEFCLLGVFVSSPAPSFLPLPSSLAIRFTGLPLGPLGRLHALQAVGQLIRHLCPQSAHHLHSPRG